MTDPEDMSWEELQESEKYCGDERENSGEVCTADASYPDNRCGWHSEYSNIGANKGEARAMKHGLYAEDSVYYQNVSETEQKKVRQMFHAFLDDAPFDEANVGKCEMLWQIAIDLSKRKKANDYIAEEGMVTEKVDGVAEGYGEIVNTEENELHIAYDRLGRTATRQLKELGVLDSPDDRQADAQETFLDLLADSAEE